MINDEIQGTISSVDADCDIPASTEYYDVARGAFVMQFDMNQFVKFPNCVATNMNPLLQGRHLFNLQCCFM